VQARGVRRRVRNREQVCKRHLTSLVHEKRIERYAKSSRAHVHAVPAAMSRSPTLAAILDVAIEDELIERQPRSRQAHARPGVQA
jgi:hypothetical protein